VSSRPRDETHGWTLVGSKSAPDSPSRSILPSYRTRGLRTRRSLRFTEFPGVGQERTMRTERCASFGSAGQTISQDTVYVLSYARRSESAGGKGRGAVSARPKREPFKSARKSVLYCHSAIKAHGRGGVWVVLTTRRRGQKYSYNRTKVWGPCDW